MKIFTRWAVVEVSDPAVAWACQIPRLPRLPAPHDQLVSRPRHDGPRRWTSDNVRTSNYWRKQHYSSNNSGRVSTGKSMDVLDKVGLSYLQRRNPIKGHDARGTPSEDALRDKSYPQAVRRYYASSLNVPEINLRSNISTDTLKTPRKKFRQKLANICTLGLPPVGLSLSICPWLRFFVFSYLSVSPWRPLCYSATNYRHLWCFRANW